jgi:UDP-2,3-diacylglucosamine hydrolase
MLTIESTHASYFISDVHLSDARPDITERFIAFFESLFLNGTYPRNVFILGDLFNTWLGDDVTTPLVQQITTLFQRCEKYNITLYFMAGNRDYLLGQAFSQKAKVNLIPDPVLAKLCDETILLTHGDQLMTLDKKYIWYRGIAQHDFIKQNFPKLPLWFRNWFAGFLRTRSKKQNYKKPKYIMDANPVTVNLWLKSFQAPNMIHGHVHHMGIHSHPNGAKRYVLGDWYTVGNYILVDKDSISLKTL